MSPHRLDERVVTRCRRGNDRRLRKPFKGLAGAPGNQKKRCVLKQLLATRCLKGIGEQPGGHAGVQQHTVEIGAF